MNLDKLYDEGRLVPGKTRIHNYARDVSVFVKKEESPVMGGPDYYIFSAICPMCPGNIELYSNGRRRITFPECWKLVEDTIGEPVEHEEQKRIRLIKEQMSIKEQVEKNKSNFGTPIFGGGIVKEIICIYEFGTVYDYPIFGIVMKTKQKDGVFRLESIISIAFMDYITTSTLVPFDENDAEAVLDAIRLNTNRELTQEEKESILKCVNKWK